MTSQRRHGTKAFYPRMGADRSADTTTTAGIMPVTAFIRNQRFRDQVHHSLQSFCKYIHEKLALKIELANTSQNPVNPN